MIEEKTRVPNLQIDLREVADWSCETYPSQDDIDKALRAPGASPRDGS